MIQITLINNCQNLTLSGFEISILCAGSTLRSEKSDKLITNSNKSEFKSFVLFFFDFREPLRTIP